jgi:site-specific recombinase XerD
MLKNSYCTDPRTANSIDRRYLQNFRIQHSSPSLREGARLKAVRDNLGHVEIDVTQTFLRDPKLVTQLCHQLARPV